MRKTSLFLSMLCASLSMNAQVATVSSPDGKLKVNFDIQGTKPVYEVIYDGKQMLDYSPLGFVADNGDFTQGINCLSNTTDHLSFDYTLDRSKFSNVHVESNQLKVNLENAKKLPFSIEFRVSNNDIAFRYSIPNQPSRAYGKKFSMRIMSEATGFDFPHQTTTFLTPQS